MDEEYDLVRVARGGCFITYTAFLRASHRDEGPPNIRAGGNGFRCARFVQVKYKMSDSIRVVRGGSFFYDAAYLRAGLRAGFSPGARSVYLGFRCAR